MASAQGGSLFPAPTESRILSQLQRDVAIDQIINRIFVFLLSIISICLFIRRFCILFLEHAFISQF